jgi:hypothetical protein
VYQRAEDFDIPLILEGRMFIEIVCWNARRRTIAWFGVEISEEQQRIVNGERSSHPNQRVREKMLVLWLLHKG